jgi:hypothetical protein
VRRRRLWRGWATKTEESRFSQTANSAEAVGDAARHAQGKVKAPADPMPLGEARTLIRRILEKWIRWKVEKGSEKPGPCPTAERSCNQRQEQQPTP